MSSHASVDRLLRTSINCEIQPGGSTTIAAFSGESVALPYNASGIGRGTGIVAATSLVSDSTGTTFLPASDTGPAGSRSFVVDVGPSAGTLVVRATCTAGCLGFPSNTTMVQWATTGPAQIEARSLEEDDTIIPSGIDVRPLTVRTIAVVSGNGRAEPTRGGHTSAAIVLGVKFGSATGRDWGILMSHFQAEWERKYRDDPQSVGARSASAPGVIRPTTASSVSVPAARRFSRADTRVSSKTSAWSASRASPRPTWPLACAVSSD